MFGARRGERHLSHRTGWLRAAVLGANDGIVSTAAIIVGVTAADSSRAAILADGIAGPVAGATSMAAIYRDRGLSPRLAGDVAAELSARDDVLWCMLTTSWGTTLSHTRPFQAAARLRLVGGRRVR